MDVTVTCPANDHEIYGNVMAYQVRLSAEAANQHLIVRRLEPAPPIDDIREDTVFAGPKLGLDSGLPPLSQSSNGPEPAVDVQQGIEFVYTKESATGHWFLARWANDCVDLADDCWAYREFPNANGAENRWGPFATLASLQAAKVAYYRTPGPRDANKRLAWRELEDGDLAHERIIADPEVTFLGPWARIGNRDFMLALKGPPDGDQQVILYAVTPPFHGSRLQVITSGPGSRDAAIYRTDPATGRPTIFTVNAVGVANVMEVYQRIGNAWTHLYDFDAASVGETDPGKPYVQSPEPFVSAGRLYVAFVTSDTPDFSTTLKGNIRIARIDATGPPTFYRVLSDETLDRKRTEPEIHYPTNDAPVVFYSQKVAVDGEDGCNLGDNMLRRARTGLAP
jgi:hypothetical protein